MEPLDLFPQLAEALAAADGGGPDDLGAYVLLLRHAERPSVAVADLDRNERDALPASDEGLADARNAWACHGLPRPGPVAAWGVPRTRQTARAIVEGAVASSGGLRPTLCCLPGMASRGTAIEWRGGRPGLEFEYAKQTLGWETLMERWLCRDPTLPSSVLTPPQQIVPHLLTDWLACVRLGRNVHRYGGLLSVVVASDFHVLAVLSELRGLRGEAQRVPFLGGALLRVDEMEAYLQTVRLIPRNPTNVRRWHSASVCKSCSHHCYATAVW